MLVFFGERFDPRLKLYPQFTEKRPVTICEQKVHHVLRQNEQTKLEEELTAMKSKKKNNDSYKAQLIHSFENNTGR